MIKDLSANDLDKQVTELVAKYDTSPLADELYLVGMGQQMEVKDETGRPNRYYQWLACLIKLVEPKQVVELGAAAGISTIMMAHEMPIDSVLYSVDYDPLAWRWMMKEYPQVRKVFGNDLDLSIYPKDCDLSKTDIWFIDSLHTGGQLQKELVLYKPFFKKGAIVVFDDIRMPGLWEIWQKLPYDKCETTNPNHFSGFGHIVI